jgi:hypothetical protein
VNKVLQCHCGFEACAPGEDGLVAEVQRHALEEHGMRLDDEEALLLTFRVQLDEGAPTEIVEPDHTEKEER